MASKKRSKEDLKRAGHKSDMRALLTQIIYARLMINHHPNLNEIINKGCPFNAQSIESRRQEITELIEELLKEEYVALDENKRYYLTKKGNKVTVTGYISFYD